jgi:hypothetical protein
MRQEQRHLRTTSNVGWLTIDEGSQQASRACDAGARVRNLSWTQTDAGHGPHAFHSSVMMPGLATRFVCFFRGAKCMRAGRWAMALSEGSTTCLAFVKSFGPAKTKGGEHICDHERKATRNSWFGSVRFAAHLVLIFYSSIGVRENGVSEV